MNTRSLLASCALAVSFASTVPVALAQADERSPRTPNLAFLVERGTNLPEQELVADGDRLTSEQRFEVVSGHARFVDGRGSVLSVTRDDGRLVLPALVPSIDESLVRVTSGNVQRVVRIISLPVERFSEVDTAAALDPQAVLERYKHAARVDYDRLLALAPAHSEYSAYTLAGEPVETRAGCSLPTYFYGPGRVFWQMSNPRAYGYSVKLENANNYLVWGSGSMQEVDGMYNSAWACNTAYKVPNNCDLQAGTGGFGCCCVGLALPRCEWFNPGPPGDWPDCPLR